MLLYGGDTKADYNTKKNERKCMFCSLYPVAPNISVTHSVQNALTNDTVMLCATILGDMRNIDAFLKQSHLHSQAVCHTYLDLPTPGGYACRVFTQKPKLINLYETVLRLVC